MKLLLVVLILAVFAGLIVYEMKHHDATYPLWRKLVDRLKSWF